MSLITRCPACETMFKVVPDQLRISEGWVRCGQCDEIFDASLHLVQVPLEQETPAAGQEARVARYDETGLSDDTLPPVDAALDSGSLGSPDEVPVEQVQPLLDPTDDVDIDAERSLPELMPDGFSGLTPPTAALPDHLVLAAPDGTEPDSSADLSDVSFLRDSKAGSFWHKPLMRATLVLLGLTLLLGLVGQIVVHERDRIVAAQPGLRPGMLALCGALNCPLSPLRQIESIVIDSSSFSKIRGDSYRLNFTFKNTAITELAIPAIELTLTDSRDQPVVRRVFLPAELGAKLDTLAAGSEWPASLAIAVSAAGMAERVTGYRLLAFYP